LIKFGQENFVGLLVYLPRCLGHAAAKWPFWSSSQAATYYYQSNHSKVEEIQLSVLPKDRTRNLLADLHTIPFYCWTSSRETVNTNLVWLGQGIGPKSTDYEADALITWATRW